MGFELVTYILVAYAVTHCAKLLHVSNNFGKDYA